MGAGWMGWGALGLLFSAAAWVLAELQGMLRKVERRIAGTPPPSISQASLLGWLCDMVIVVLVAWVAARDGGSPFLGHVFAPLMLIFMLRILPRSFPEGTLDWIEDRVVLAALLALAAASGVVFLLVQLLAAGLAIAAIALRGDERESG
jgi:hypothetical protein